MRSRTSANVTAGDHGNIDLGGGRMSTLWLAVLRSLGMKTPIMLKDRGRG